MGAGCAFIDYDNDGWPDILLLNGMDWAGHRRQRSTLRLYRNNRNGTFTDVTKAAGLDVEMYGLGVAAADYDNDGWQDIYISCLGQSRLFRNTGKGTFVDVTAKSGLGGRQGFSTSALWFDYDRDGHLDLFVCNYVRWTLETDIHCSFDGRAKAYCTPEAYRGATCWLFRNRGDGTFEEVTAKSKVFDSTSKALGVAMLDYDNDGWPDLFVANDTQPNKLYRNNHDGTFSEVAVRAGLAFSEDGRARAGMGADAADFDNSGFPGIAVTNFDNEMMGLYRGSKEGVFRDVAARSELGQRTRRTLGFACLFFDADMSGSLDLMTANGHIDESITRARPDISHAQAPLLFLNDGAGNFSDFSTRVGSDFGKPRVARGAAVADFDHDGDLDLLMTTNGGSPVLLRNERTNANNWVRLRLRGVQSNRDAIGAVVRFEAGDLRGTRVVRTGSSYLSQSELTLTIGLGRRGGVDRLVVTWPNGKAEEHRNVKAKAEYLVTEGGGIQPG
jgi:hypothetical protein